MAKCRARVIKSKERGTWYEGNIGKIYDIDDEPYRNTYYFLFGSESRGFYIEDVEIIKPVTLSREMFEI